jgi:cell division protein FtsZ
MEITDPLKPRRPVFLRHFLKTSQLREPQVLSSTSQGGSGLSLYEVNEASTLITEAAHEDAEIIFGAVIDENMGEAVRVTVIATGFNQNLMQNPATRPATHEQMQIMQQQMQVARQAMNREQQQMQQQMQYQQPMMPQPQVMPTPPPIPPVTMSVEEERVELPPLPQEPVAAAPTPQPAVETPRVTAPAQEQAFTPPAPAPANETKALPRDILMAKARAYKEQTAMQSRQGSPEQLSMEVESEEKEENLDLPLNQNDLEVPTYLRRQQSNQEDREV